MALFGIPTHAYYRILILQKARLLCKKTAPRPYPHTLFHIQHQIKYNKQIFLKFMHLKHISFVVVLSLAMSGWVDASASKKRRNTPSPDLKVIPLRNIHDQVLQCASHVHAIHGEGDREPQNQFEQKSNLAFSAAKKGCQLGFMGIIKTGEEGCHEHCVSSCPHHVTLCVLACKCGLDPVSCGMNPNGT